MSCLGGVNGDGNDSCIVVSEMTSSSPLKLDMLLCSTLLADSMVSGSCPVLATALATAPVSALRDVVTPASFFGASLSSPVAVSHEVCTYTNVTYIIAYV